MAAEQQEHQSSLNSLEKEEFASNYDEESDELKINAVFSVKLYFLHLSEILIP